MVIGGDFNAEVGQNLTQTHAPTIGPWTGPHTSRTGMEFADWCLQEGPTALDSRFLQPITKRYTWWHPSKGTGHTLDHFVLRQHQVKYVDNTKTVHEGRRGNAGEPLGRKRTQPEQVNMGIDYWDDYTDHLPIEIKFHFYPHVKKRRVSYSDMPARPNVQLLALPGDRGNYYRTIWKEALDSAIHAHDGNTQQLTWPTLVDICLQTFLEAVGPVPQRQYRPHLVGREDENTQLDQEVGNALAELRSFMHDILPRTPERHQQYVIAKQHSQAAARKRRRTRMKWKWEWIDILTDELTTAHQQNHTKRVYQIHKQLGLREQTLNRPVVSEQPADPADEREAWKAHFQNIQAGREVAEEHVWTNVKREPVAQWLTDPLSNEEIHRCALQMKNGKATGSDGFVAEFYKYGTPGLQTQIQGFVQQMWNSALAAPIGHEAQQWPEDWSTGIVVPLWKQKGDKKDKNTYRGITLLSVGSKILARVVAQRVQQWSETWITETQAGFRKGRG